MLSILIPTYNYNPQALVDKLNSQAKQLGIKYEIFVLDDASTEPLKITGCEVIKLTRNVGRARSRNILATYAHYPYLLFLDSDSMPAKDDFLKRYIDNAKPDIVLSGGRIYHPQPNSLLTLYGAKERYDNPKPVVSTKKPFTSPNFLIDAELFNVVKFDEFLTKYGHEDTIFGIELLCHGIKYYRFDNPVYHEHIESNADYVSKVELSLQTLVTLLTRYPELLDLPIIRLTKNSKRKKKSLIVRLLRKRLASPNKKPSLFLLQLYKYLYIKTLK